VETIPRDAGPRIRFGVEVLGREHRGQGDLRVVAGVWGEKELGDRIKAAGLAAPDEAKRPQGYAVLPSQESLFVVGGDDAGAMYGLLDVAEQVRHGATLRAVKARASAPYIEMRGIKLNIPLDARTPSYSDAGTAAQENIAHMWDWSFWDEYLDTLALHRFNLVTLWGPHVFPSMVRVDEFPDVALDDVCRADVDWKAFQRRFKLSGANMVTREILGSLKIVRRMTMDEKMAFWRKVMRRADERNIRFYVITWNIFPWGAEGKHGITADQTNPTTVRYYRESVKAMFRTYPLLGGLGVTAGERMPNRKTQEDWLWEAYGRAVHELRREFPERGIRFIHRHHWAKMRDVLKRFDALGGQIDFSFKYARARLYSKVDPPWIHLRRVLDERPDGVRVWWNLRNDDIYHFRWGDPDYVRAFIRNLPEPGRITPGFYMGPDAYVFGRVVSDRASEGKPRLEFDKHWLRTMLWGRLAYDPSLPDELFRNEIARRLPGVDADALFEAWRTASRIIPQVNRFHWHENDFQWNVEGCMSNSSRFHDVLRFMKQKPMPRSGIMPIKDFARDPGTAHRNTPMHVAARLDGWAAEALAVTASLKTRAEDDSLATVLDIEAMAHLGRYYASKIRAATRLGVFERSRDADEKRRALAHLEEAVGHWDAYSRNAAARYRPQVLARCGEIDFRRTLESVRKDIDIAKAFKGKD
jgi:hypothetical protein